MINFSKDNIIKIESLSVKTFIGLYPEEKLAPQELLIDLKIIFDANRAMASDDLLDTIDYFQIASLVKEKVEASNFLLLEKLAHFILEIVIKFNKVKAAEVTIYKPKALENFGALVSFSAAISK